MVIRKYIAKTEEEAVGLAKEELGRDVVIMNVKKNGPKGLARLFRKQSVEVTAAVDEVLPGSPPEEKIPDFAKLQEAMEQQEFKSAPDSRAARAKAAREELLEKHQVILDDEEPPEEEKPADGANAIEQKLSDLQDLLERQIGTPREEGQERARPDKTQACLQLIRSQMENNEVEPAYIEQILEDIEGSLQKDAYLDNILSSVYQKIVLKIGRPQLIDTHAQKRKYVFFIGPTGVGKTTTIAKIASTLKLSGKLKVALITSDTYRIAAVEQLRTYANILTVPLRVVYAPEEMEKTMEDLEHYDLVLIDTAGRSHNNEAQREDIRRLLETVPAQQREVFLVMSATTKYKDLVNIAQAYSQITKYSLIFTKLDETDAIGNVFNIRMLTGAPLSYMAWGQNVPDDIGKVDAQKMAKQLLGGSG